MKKVEKIEVFFLKGTHKYTKPVSQLKEVFSKSCNKLYCSRMGKNGKAFYVPEYCSINFETAVDIIKELESRKFNIVSISFDPEVEPDWKEEPCFRIYIE